MNLNTKEKSAAFTDVRRGSVSKYVRSIIAVAMSVLTAYAISYLTNLTITGAGASFGLLATLSAAGATCSLQDMLLALPVGIIIWLGPPPRREWPKSVCLLAFVLDLIIFASAAMGSTHHLGSLYADRSHVALSLLFLVVFWVYLVYVLCAVFRRVSTFASHLFGAVLPSNGFSTQSVLNASLGRASHIAGAKTRIFLFSFVILLIAWAPYVISMAPGSDCPDMGWQISQYVNGSYSSHHPLYATFIYGFVFSLGNVFAGVNGGLLAAMLFQTLVLAFVSSLEILELAKMGFTRSALIAALIFFAIVPVFGSYCQWIVKDSLFGACFALYATIYIRCCISVEKEEVSVQNLVPLLGISLLSSLLRNNAFYAIALAALAFALVFRRKLSIAKLALLLAVIPLTVVFNQAALMGTQAQKGDIREALSIPFQQTARYAKEHSNDVTKEEKAVIDAVLDYSDLAERYNWAISDAVKGKAKTDDKAALVEYFKVWFAQGLRHPVCYIDSFLDQTFGYWSIVNPSIYEQEFAGGFDTSQVGQNLNQESGKFFATLANKAKSIISVLRNMPFLGLFSVSGFYMLVALTLAALTFYCGKSRVLILLAPSVLLWLTCMAGPLNGSIRYSFGIIASFPIVVGAVLYMLFGQACGQARHQGL